MPDEVITPRRTTTRRDVARMAGVSDAVVTYTLNGGAPVAAATARRVLDAVDALGYQPNQSARALKSGSAKTLALILPDVTNSFFVELGRALELTARLAGYALYRTTTSELSSTLALFRDFAARQVDGVLLVPGDVALDAHALDRIGIPWVLVDASVPRPGVASVSVDLYAGAVAVVSHLASHGHRRVAFVGDVDADEPRYRGWKDACAQLDLEPGRSFATNFSREAGYAAGPKLIAPEGLERAVFAASDMIAIGLLRSLHEHGVGVPDQIAIASFDGSWESAYSWPALTTVKQPIDRMAGEAISQLLDRSGSSRGHSVFPGELIERASCGRHVTRLAETSQPSSIQRPNRHNDATTPE